ncbi:MULTISPECIES: hypothetical protein [Clostridium]|uniref:Uncharacterized protein n=1 Tax=Clostridium aquiflavi TaxID=3073603 RepID=A0ABU1EG01_9CLOT|nr:MULTISPECIES: hypothetical protein [unclassified Clostridium]MDR5587093.1 hypothetical protein [Clostridium sp. 5N-1]NFG61296.1 hypothetical protein [Clostridium botulinum]NFQ09233.1 hypothetical protein [Clostridium botulinum]
MRISTGSILQFDVIFNIPVNTTFDEITITDPLAAGLSYNTTTKPAKIYINDSTTATTAGVTDTSTATSIALALDNTIVGNLTAIKKVKASIPVTVTNADTLLAAIAAAAAAGTPLKNIATIKALNATGTELSTTTAEATLNTFGKCNLFGFGSAYTVEKAPNKDLYLMANIPGIGSMETTELEYEIVITAESHLVPGPEANIKVYIGDAAQTPVTPTVATIVGNVITIKFTQSQNMKNNTVYIEVPAKTGTNIADVTDDFVNSDATAKLVYTPSGGTASTVCTSPDFVITTNLTPAAPILSSAQKVIV